MIFIATMLTSEDQILEAVKEIRTGHGTKQSRAIMNLVDTYKSDLSRAVNSVRKYLKPGEDIANVQQFVTRVFTEILLAPNLEYDTKSRLDSYIRSLLPQRINKVTLRDELGYEPLIKSMQTAERLFPRGISQFHTREHREPDFRNPEDIKLLAGILNTSVENVEDWVSMLGAGRIKSIYEQVSGGEDADEDKLLIVDSLTSEHEIPDKMYYDKSLMQTIDHELRRLVTPTQYQLLQLYYHFNDPDADKITMPELSEKLHIPLSTVKLHIKQGIQKLIQKSPLIQDWIRAATIKKLVKEAMKVFALKIVNGKYQFTQIHKQSNEAIVKEVIASYGIR